MYISSSIITLVVAVSTTQAFQLADFKAAASEVTRSVSDATSSLFTRRGGCPAVWSEISTTLTAQFLADGQCTDAARAAIRGAFHDCFNGGKFIIQIPSLYSC
jgi:hypothetical protein